MTDTTRRTQTHDPHTVAHRPAPRSARPDRIPVSFPPAPSISSRLMAQNNRMTARLAIYLGTVDTLLHHPGVLAADERQRLQRMNSTRRRRQFSAGRHLLRHALSHDRPGMAPTAWQVVVQDGRPTLATSGRPDFSLSHSGEHVGCIICHNGRCGLDLQVHRHRSRELAEACFNPRSNDWLARQPNADLAFHQLWVLKEAWAKATATPLLSALKNTCWTMADSASAQPAAWAGGTTEQLGTLTLGWVASPATAAPDVWMWQSGGFVPLELDWTTWIWCDQADTQCGT